MLESETQQAAQQSTILFYDLHFDYDGCWMHASLLSPDKARETLGVRNIINELKSAIEKKINTGAQSVNVILRTNNFSARSDIGTDLFNYEGKAWWVRDAKQDLISISSLLEALPEHERNAYPSLEESKNIIEALSKQTELKDASESDSKEPADFSQNIEGIRPKLDKLLAKADVPTRLKMLEDFGLLEEEAEKKLLWIPAAFPNLTKLLSTLIDEMVATLRAEYSNCKITIVTILNVTQPLVDWSPCIQDQSIDAIVKVTKEELLEYSGAHFYELLTTKEHDKGKNFFSSYREHFEFIILDQNLSQEKLDQYQREFLPDFLSHCSLKDFRGHAFLKGGKFYVVIGSQWKQKPDLTKIYYPDEQKRSLALISQLSAAYLQDNIKIHSPVTFESIMNYMDDRWNIYWPICCLFNNTDVTALFPIAVELNVFQYETPSVERFNKKSNSEGTWSLYQATKVEKANDLLPFQGCVLLIIQDTIRAAVDNVDHYKISSEKVTTKYENAMAALQSVVAEDDQKGKLLSKWSDSDHVEKLSGSFLQKRSGYKDNNLLTLSAASSRLPVYANTSLRKCTVFPSTPSSEQHKEVDEDAAAILPKTLAQKQEALTLIQSCTSYPNNPFLLSFERR